MAVDADETLIANSTETISFVLDVVPHQEPDKGSEVTRPSFHPPRWMDECWNTSKLPADRQPFSLFSRQKTLGVRLCARKLLHPVASKFG
jgi:hypothetical protein